MTDLFDTSQLQLSDPNPMVVALGAFGENKKCKHCKHCIQVQPGANKYFKCALRKITHGPKTDIRVNWNACKKFESLTQSQNND